MANPEHLSKLKQGFAAWNQWRSEHNISPDLREANLRWADLAGPDLHNAQLQGADLTEAFLSGGQLHGARLQGAHLRSADLIRVDDAVTEATIPWAADPRRTRHIGDFTRWKDHDPYQKAFERLLRDLKAESTEDSASASQ